MAKRSTLPMGLASSDARVCPTCVPQMAQPQQMTLTSSVWQTLRAQRLEKINQWVTFLAGHDEICPPHVEFEKRGLLEKGSFQKCPFSRDSREVRDDHFLEILENLEILEILKISPAKRPLSQWPLFPVPNMADPHGDPQTSPQHADPHGFLVCFSFKRHQIHVDQHVVGWSAGRHVDHPCGGQISPWPARKVTESWLIAWHFQSMRLKFSIQAWKFQSRLKLSVSLDMFTPDLDNSPQRSGSFARGRCRRGRSEIPHFWSKLLLFALVLQEKRRKAEKNEEKQQKTKNA